MRALGDDDDVGTVLAVQRLAQASCRQQFVVDDEPVVVDEQDIDAGLDIAVLEGIVEQDDIQLLVEFHELVDGMTAVFIDRHRNILELLLHLVGLVANLGHGDVGSGDAKTLALALVSPTEYGHAELVFQQLGEIFDMGCLARASDGDVAYSNNRYGE